MLQAGSIVGGCIRATLEDVRDRLDPERVAAAMRERGIENANQLANKTGVHRATAARWIKGQVPENVYVPIVTSVLGKSLEWLMGAAGFGEQSRPALVRALREELGQDGDCPEADIVEALGAFTFEQRKLLRQLILHGAGKVETVTPIADAGRREHAPAAADHAKKRARRHR